MNWWRAHHGISHDPKLALVAKRAEAKRCEVLAVWVSLLDHASQHEERGSISGIDHEEISFQTDIPVEVVRRIIAQFLIKDMVGEDNRLAAWDKRQYGDLSTERVKRHRENKALSIECNGVKRNETNETRDETPVTVETPRIEQNRTEQNRTQKGARVLPWPEAFDFEAWFQRRLDKHPIPGKPQIAKQYALDKVWSAFKPDEFDAAHNAWCEFWSGKDGGIPSLATFIFEDWWKRAPPKRKKSLDELADEVGRELEAEKAEAAERARLKARQ